MASFGWDHPFADRTWQQVRGFPADVDWPKPENSYSLDIIDSVINTGADEVLAVATSMHDPAITPRPATDPPFDVVIVCAPGSGRRHPEGSIRIDFQSALGKHTEIVRPASEALPLFWRFMQSEFGVRPTQT